MSGSHAPALPAFLTFLGSFPDPASVARALVSGPFASVDALSCIVMVAHEDAELRLISTHGLTDAANDRYRTIPLRLNVPIVTAYKENRTLSSDISGFSDAFPALQIDRPLWSDIEDSTGGASLLDAPIRLDDAPLGVIGLVCAERPWVAADLALVDGICAALAMWITHPRSRVGRLLGTWEAAGGESLHLTARQEVILLLIEQEKSNAEIAAALGYSPSTVKHEILRIAHSLRASDRHDAVRRAREIGLLI